MSSKTYKKKNSSVQLKHQYQTFHFWGLISSDLSIMHEELREEQTTIYRIQGTFWLKRNFIKNMVRYPVQNSLNV